MDDFEKRPVRRRVFDGVTRSLVLLGAGLTIALLVALIAISLCAACRMSPGSCSALRPV